MSKEALLFISLATAFGGLGLFAIARFSYTVGERRQQELLRHFGTARRRIRWGLHFLGLAAFAIAVLGLLANVDVLVWFGLYVVLVVATHRIAYLRGKKTATDRY